MHPWHLKISSTARFCEVFLFWQEIHHNLGRNPILQNQLNTSKGFNRSGPKVTKTGKNINEIRHADYHPTSGARHRNLENS
jgi:hypothetical protein